MSVASHLGINLDEYDARIRTFIPRYEDVLDAAAAALATLAPASPLVIDLGTGTGALAARCAAAVRRARFIGIDSDEGILAVASRRVGRRLTPRLGDLLTAPLPRCQAITASFSLHHVRTPAEKRALYRRCFRALTRGGVLINADCCPASSPALRTRDHAAWRRHLQGHYSAREAAGFLRAWAREDVYMPLADEVAWLTAAGFAVDVPWRDGAFAVIAARKIAAGRRGA